MSAGSGGTMRRVRKRVAASPAAPLARRLNDALDAARRRPAEPSAPVSSPSWGTVPDRFAVKPRPRSIDADWPQPPDIERPGAVVRSIYDTGDRPPVMDLALLEALNEEYRSKPLVPEPPANDPSSREDRARQRILGVHREIDLADKRTLELGCGVGVEVWYVSHHLGADAWGVDVCERKAWSELADERTHYVLADLATDRPFEADFFDRVYSFAVFEHVVHPWALLSELYRIMKPGGLAHINANLHRGPKASHIYRELYFPFPHLLFSDDVIREFRMKHHGIDAGASWVNRLSWAQYEDYFREVGFEIRSLRFRETPLDDAFYQRFSHILGRYPRWDLTRDFFDVVVEKPRR